MINEINKFIRLANIGNVKTKEFTNEVKNNNKALIGSFFVKVAFGQGTPAPIPWISIGRYSEFKEDGPVFLYFKDKNKIVLSFGLKEREMLAEDESNTSIYNFKWNDDIINNYQTVAQYFGGPVVRYGDSWVFKVYDVVGGTIAAGTEIDEDLTKMLAIYRKQLPESPLVAFIKNNYKAKEEETTKVIQDERNTFINLFPLDKLVGMTLDDYSRTGNYESFTNMIERRTPNLCSGNLGNNDHKLFYPENGVYKVLRTVSNAYATLTTVEDKFKQFKTELEEFISNFNLETYHQIKLLNFNSNVLKFKIIRLYRPDIKMYGLPSKGELDKVLAHLNLPAAKRDDDSIKRSKVLTDYLLENYPEITNLNTDIINNLIWDYKVKYIDVKQPTSGPIVIPAPTEPKKLSRNLSENIILFGPPGTGKTYNTKNYAVSICEQKTVEEVKKEDYKEVIKRYDEYVKRGQIMFTTFHQSYSYEDFIEGIKPKINNDGNITYEVEDGVFKAFCLAHQPTFDELWDFFVEDVNNREILWGDIAPSAGEDTKTKKLEANNANSVIIPYGNGVTLTKENAKKLYLGEVLEKSKVNEYSYVMDYFQKKYVEAPRIFIIDEINRGNISKILGELITLIEPNKRKGEIEAMSVTLPYSKEVFSIPNNIHLIGTMNTADRSIALMDTALRRRFVFKEMMPEPELLKGKGFEGLDLEKMLKTINTRIEVLYDREHMIGHSYFMDDNLNLKKLGLIFKNKIIPLLQEYFYEDYEKIRLVLGDNDKKDEKFIFIKEVPNSSNIFKKAVDSDLYPENRYEINEQAFFEIESYKQII